MGPPYRSILFPTDLSDHSFAAWEHALGLARAFNAEIHAVTVIEEPYALAAGDHYAALVTVLRDVKPQVEQRLRDRLRDKPAAYADVNVCAAVLEAASPATALVEYARRNRIDLVVMATHGRTGITHLLLGSTAEKLVRTAPVPVLTVRPTP